VPYILMSKASGHQLSEYDWSPSSHHDHVPSKYSLKDMARPLSEERKREVVGRLGAIAWQLSRLRFDKIGSLFQDPAGGYTIDECLSPSLTWQGRDSLEGIDRGPYDNESAYLDALISAYTSHARELPMTPHAFFAPLPEVDEYASWASYRAAAARWNDFVAVGEKIDHSKNRLAYCIAGDLMREMMPRVRQSRKTPPAGNGFPLSHPDLHVGNIFVDDNLNITCIIDWGSAASVPLTELLAAPGLLHRRSPAEQDPLVGAFRAGFERASSGGGGVPVGPGTWARADMVRLLQRLFRMLSKQDYHDFGALYSLAHRGDGQDGDGDGDGEGEGDGEGGAVDMAALFSERMGREENRRLLEELAVDDMPRDEVERCERASFGSPSSRAGCVEKLAVARKLTVAAEMNGRFVADWRVWRWVEEALRDGDGDGDPGVDVSAESDAA
jgi:hypothetical protein